MIFTESMLNSYAQPLSQTEDQQCKNAIHMIVNALKPLGFKETRTNIEPMYNGTYAYFQELESELGYRRIKIFLQGSYANNTNVRTKSDVDIAVVEEDIFQTKYRFGLKDSDYGFTEASARPKGFKDEVQEALKKEFGSDVVRENKSIRINGNTYRKDADSVPCRRYRDYSRDYSKNPENFIGGIVITSDKGERIINYPEQHIKNGKEKNVSTNYYYKKMVRIVKKIRYLMIEEGISAAENVNSFILESLFWNIPDNKYIEYKSYRNVFMFDMLIKYLKNNNDLLSTFKEANGIKSLCPTSNELRNVNLFIDALLEFYEYE